MKGNRTNHPRKWMRWDDWESWLLKEWTPFKYNDLPHLNDSIKELQTDMVWIKCLLGGIVLAIIGTAIAVITTG